jgi:hypothetical protein
MNMAGNLTKYFVSADLKKAYFRQHSDRLSELAQSICLRPGRDHIRVATGVLPGYSLVAQDLSNRHEKFPDTSRDQQAAALRRIAFDNMKVRTAC